MDVLRVVPNLERQLTKHRLLRRGQATATAAEIAALGQDGQFYNMEIMRRHRDEPPVVQRDAYLVHRVHADPNSEDILDSRGDDIFIDAYDDAGVEDTDSQTEAYAKLSSEQQRALNDAYDTYHARRIARIEDALSTERLRRGVYLANSAVGDENRNQAARMLGELRTEIDEESTRRAAKRQRTSDKQSGTGVVQESAVQRELEGGAASLQSILDRAYAPMKAPRRKVAPMSHRGASANQTSYALSGRPPPLPGTHEMSNGMIMRD